MPKEGVGETVEEALFQKGDEGGRAAYEAVDVLAALVREDQIVGALEEGVAHVAALHPVAVDLVGHQTEGRTVPHVGILDRTVVAVVLAVEREGFGVLQREALKLAREQAGFESHGVAGIERPFVAVLHGDEVAVDDKAQHAVLPVVGHVVGPRHEVGMAQPLRLDGYFYAHVLAGHGEKIGVLFVFGILVALRAYGTDQLFGQHLVAAEIRSRARGIRSSSRKA